jgi:iron(III) transport system substrate-binding protein
MIRSILLLCTLVLAPTAANATDPAVIDAARKEAALAVADTAPGENFQKFMAAFKAKYPFLDIATGFYSAPTGRVLARVNAEIDAKRLSFDVMLAANTAAWIEMTSQGRIAKYDSPEYAAFPAGAKMDGYWAAAQAIGVIPVYNRNTLPPGVSLQSWRDLLRPEFAGHKLAIQNAAAGTQFNWNYLLEHTLGPDYTRQFAAQQPVVMATGAQLTDAVTRGEVQVAAALDHWRGFTPDAAKAGLVAVYPTEGVPLTLAPVGMLAGAPHPNAAKLFIDFILSQEGQRLLDTELYGMYSMRSDVPPPAGQKPLSETHALLPTDTKDYMQASRDFPQHFEELFH